VFNPYKSSEARPLNWDTFRSVLTAAFVVFPV